MCAVFAGVEQIQSVLGQFRDEFPQLKNQVLGIAAINSQHQTVVR
jgi:hypothetical protein